MDWKLKIKALCKEWGIKEPDFILSKSELRKISHHNRWAAFMQKYPKIFNDADVWVKSQIEDEFLVTHARLSNPKIFGKLRGHYVSIQLQDSDISIFTIDSRAKSQETTILHEFYHHLIEQWGCVDSDEEKHAELFARSKKFRDAVKRKCQKLQNTKRIILQKNGEKM